MDLIALQMASTNLVSGQFPSLPSLERLAAAQDVAAANAQDGGDPAIDVPDANEAMNGDQREVFHPDHDGDRRRTTILEPAEHVHNQRHHRRAPIRRSHSRCVLVRNLSAPVARPSNGSLHFPHHRAC